MTALTRSASCWQCRCAPTAAGQQPAGQDTHVTGHTHASCEAGGSTSRCGMGLPNSCCRLPARCDCHLIRIHVTPCLYGTCLHTHKRKQTGQACTPNSTPLADATATSCAYTSHPAFTECVCTQAGRLARTPKKTQPTLRKRSRGLAMLLVKLPASSTLEKASSRDSLQQMPHVTGVGVKV